MMSTTASPASLVFSAVEEYGSTKQIPLSDPNVDRMMQRDDLRPATRAWLESQYGVETKGERRISRINFELKKV
jgi:hypothetical protein